MKSCSSCPQHSGSCSYILQSPTRIVQISINITKTCTTYVVVATNLIVTSPTEERLTALASEGSEVEAGSGFITDPTELVNERVEVFNL